MTQRTEQAYASLVNIPEPISLATHYLHAHTHAIFFTLAGLELSTRRAIFVLRRDFNAASSSLPTAACSLLTSALHASRFVGACLL